MNSFAFFVFIPFLLAADNHDHHHHDHEHRHHGKHVHGEGNLNVVFGGNEIRFDFTAPAADVIESTGADEQKKREKELEALKQNFQKVDFWLESSSVPGCEVAQTTATTKDLPNGTCTDVNFSMRLKCDSEVAGMKPELKIFDRFKSLKKINAQIVGDSGATGAELHAKSRVVALEQN